MSADADPMPSGHTLTDGYCSSTDLAAFESAQQLGRYRLGEVLGTGGMGTVFRARDPDLKRDLAIKFVVPHGSDPHRVRVLREAESMAKLRHPNVVPIFDVGTLRESVYLVMPLLEGGTLGDWLRAEPRPWRLIAQRFLAAARGLAAAHAHGLVHRDFKPDNVLLGTDDEVQVADFGLVRMDTLALEADAARVGMPTSQDATRTGAVLGTPAYMAPEQLDGSLVDARADQFSFCVSLYEALSGRRPFAVASHAPADLAALRDRIRAGRVRAPLRGRAVPRWLRALALRGMRDDPAERWPSMQALIAALERGLRWRRWTAPWSGAVVTAAALAVVVAVRERASGDAERISAPFEVGAWFERPISARGDLGKASLSPDGRQVATRAGDALMLMSTTDGTARTLLRGVSTHATVTWSTDGGRILLGEGMQFRAIDVARGRVEAVEGVSGTFGQLLHDGTALGFAGPQSFAVTRPNMRPMQCWIPGGFVQLVRAEVLKDHLYLTLVNKDLTLSLVVMPPTCGPSRVVLDHVAALDLIPSNNGHVFAQARKGGLRGYNQLGVATGAELPFHGEPVVGIRTGLGVVFLRSDRSGRLYDPEHAERSFDDGMQHVVLAPDGRRFAVVDHRSSVGAVRIAALDELGTPSRPIATAVDSVSWSPNGDRLAGAGRGAPGGPASIQLIDARTGETTQMTVSDTPALEGLVWLDEHRVAFRSSDGRTYRWISMRDGTSGTVLDPTLGWTFELAPSRRDGTLAVFWNQKAGRGTWVIRPDGRQALIRGADRDGWLGHAWSPDGATLWSYDSAGAIHRYDVATGRLSHVRTLDLAANETMIGIYPMADGRVLVRTVAQKTDLFVYGPKRGSM